MTVPALMAKTTVNSTKEIEFQEHISPELFKEYKERKDALTVTEKLIMQELVKSPALAGLTLANYSPIFGLGQGGRHAVKVTYRVTVDGHYQLYQRTGSMDSATLNLLLNNKILTTEEKRQLLKEQGLLPLVEQVSVPQKTE